MSASLSSSTASAFLGRLLATKPDSKLVDEVAEWRSIEAWIADYIRAERE
jgi:hypothetical protein